MKIKTEFILENAMRAFVTRFTETVEFELAYMSFKDKVVIESDKAQSVPGLGVFLPGSTIVREVTRSGLVIGQEMGHIFNKEVLDVAGLLGDKQGVSLNPKGSAPMFLLPITPAPFVVTYSQMAPYTTKLFKSYKEYAMHVNDKLLNMQTRVSSFQQKYSNELSSNGKRTKASFNFEIK